MATNRKLAIVCLFNSFLILSATLLSGQNAQKQLMLADTDAPLTPTDSPGGGTYGSTQSVTLSDPTSSLILYTTDGSTPACPGTGTLYTGAISVSVTTTIKAIGCNGVTGGGVLTSVYTISGGITEVGSGSQRATSSNGGTTAAFPGNVTSGNLLIVSGCIFGLGRNILTSDFGDTISTTWAIAADYTASNNQCFVVYGVAGSSAADTVSFNAGSFRNFCIDEFHGQNATPFDAAGTGTTGTSTSPAGTITTVAANALIIGAMSYNGAGPSTLGAGTNFTLIGKQENTTYDPIIVEFRIVTTATSYSVPMTSSASITWFVMAGSFKP